MMKKSVVIIILLLLIFGIFNVLQFNSADNHSENVSDPIDTNTFLTNSRGNSRIATESNSHGGSWVDSYVDQTGIDWGNSDNINVSDNEIKITQRPPMELKVDVNTLGLWHFDENTGSIAYDESPNNNDGSISGPTWTSGIFNSSLSYSGGGHTVNVPDDPSLNFGVGESFSVEAWVKTTGVWQNIVVKYLDSFPDHYQIAIQREGSAYFQIRCSNGKNPQAVGPRISDNKWHYVVGVRDTSKDIILIYVDGELKNYVVDDTTGTISPPQSLRIGKYFGGSALPFSGKIDEVRISNRSLTAWEIANNYGLYEPSANITSSPITIPANMKWDTLSLKKDEPEGTWLNVSVLNASDDQPIPGFFNLRSSELDISALDAVQYPSIKLKAAFETNQMLTPTLNYWGVSWVAMNTWRDTFFTDMKVKSVSNLEFLDGNASVLKYQPDEYTAALWFFDEGSGTIVFDETEYDNSGYIYGSTWVSGRFGAALDFDGFNDQVAFMDRLTLGITGNITVEVWLNFTSTPSPNQYFPILKKRVIGSDTYQLCIQDDGRARFRVDTGLTKGNVTLGNTSLNDGKWHYLVGTWNRTELNIYVDGVPDAAPVPLTGLMNDTIDWVMAGYHAGDIGSVFDYYNGKMDMMRVSNTGRTAQYISNVYKNLTGPGLTFKKAELISNPIIIPDKMYWDTLMINKDEPQQTYLNLTILDAVSNQPLKSYNNFVQTNLNISSIDPHLHPSIRLKAVFETNSSATPVLNDWSVNWVPNKPPKVIDLNLPTNSVYRTNTIQINISVIDNEDTKNNLSVSISYRSPNDIYWGSLYLIPPAPHFDNDQWAINFTPAKDADLGLYSFNITCADTFSETTTRFFNNVLEVFNNPPTQPDVQIYPPMPTTQDDIWVVATNVTDVEDELISYYFSWYKNDIYQPLLTNDIVSSQYTTQFDLWKCVVTPNDGNENGTPNEAQIEILNSAPEVNNSILMITFDEDTIDRSINLFYVFKDNDNDELVFSCAGNDKLTVNIFDNGTVELAPEPDWFGTETLTFNANDTFEEASDEIVVRVMPTNDDPVLIKVIGPKNEYFPSTEIKLTAIEDEWFNFTVDAYDIDGDMLSYNTNRTDNIGDDDMHNLEIVEDLISFLPTNDDVGSVLLNLTVSDNNGSKIYQLIKIDVENVNDPPWARITLPTHGSEFTSDDLINFSCEYSDDDFNVPDTSEHLTFKWYTNQSGGLLLGGGESLSNITLEPGYHQIRVEATDSHGTSFTDSINLTITEAVKGKDTKKTVDENLWWLVLILIIIIILVLIIVFIFYKRKKQKEEAEAAAATGGEVLTPEIVSPQLTASGEPSPPPPTLQPSQQLTPSVAPTSVISSAVPQPAAGLGGPQPQVTVPRLPPVVEPEKEAESKEVKLERLKTQLLSGELTQEQYETQKHQIESEPESEPEEKLPEVTAGPPEPTQLTVVPTLEQVQVQPKIVSPQPQDDEATSEVPTQEPDEEDTDQPLAHPTQPFPEEHQSDQSQPQPQPITNFCPNCNSPTTMTFPDGSSSCSACGHKWL